MPGRGCRKDGSQFLTSGIVMVSISAIWYKDGSQFLPSGIKKGIDFQILVPSRYIARSNFCFEAWYKSNQDFGAPAAPPYST